MPTTEHEERWLARQGEYLARLGTASELMEMTRGELTFEQALAVIHAVEMEHAARGNASGSDLEDAATRAALPDAG